MIAFKNLIVILIRMLVKAAGVRMMGIYVVIVEGGNNNMGGI